MKFRTLVFGLFSAAASPLIASAQTTSPPEIDACRASSLIALKEKTPAIKDVKFRSGQCARSQSEFKDRKCRDQSDYHRRGLYRKAKNRQTTEFYLHFGREGEGLAHNIQRSVERLLSDRKFFYRSRVKQLRGLTDFRGERR